MLPLWVDVLQMDRERVRGRPFRAPLEGAPRDHPRSKNVYAAGVNGRPEDERYVPRWSDNLLATVAFSRG